IDQMVDKVRTLATELRPAVLDSLGLSAAVDWAVRQFAERTGIECTLDLPPQPVRIDTERSTDVFRILQEALTNVARHPRVIRVVIADDHPVVQAGLRQIVAAHPDLQVVGEAADGDAVLRVLGCTPADVLLLGLTMPRAPFPGLLKHVLSRYPRVRVLVMS